MRLGCDLANYSVIPTPQQVADLKAIGIRHAIVGTSFGQRADAQLAMFEDGGIATEEYQFPEQIRVTKRRWWVDCETPSATVQSVTVAMSKGGHGPYTRRGWWQDNFPAWDFKKAFPYAGLWDARYIGTQYHGTAREPCKIVQALKASADVSTAIVAEYAQLTPFVSYGGFTKPAITQWHNSVTIYGVNVDLNHHEEAEPIEEDEMKSFLAWCAEEGKVYFCGPDGPKWIPGSNGGPGPVYAELEKLFGPMTIVLSSAAIKAMGAK